MGKRLAITRFENQDTSNPTKGDIIFSNGEKAKIEDCLPLASMLKGLEDYALKFRPKTPERNFLMGVLEEIYQHSVNTEYTTPDDPFKQACLDYALGCGWAVSHEHNLSINGHEFSREAKLMAAVFLERKNKGVMMFSRAEFDYGHYRTTNDDESPLPKEIKFDPPEVGPFLEDIKAPPSRA